MNNAIIYVRVSSEEQVKGTSLDFQEESCLKYCEEKGLKVLKMFREEGASAKSADREEFLRAIEYCRTNKERVGYFVVMKCDRFARNTEDHFYVRKLLLDYGVRLVSVTEPIGNDPSEKLFETMLAGFAEFDNSIRKQRCTDGMSKKMRQGILPWQPPIGYKCLNAKKQGLKKNEPDPIDPEIFPIIQRALKEYAKGMHSQKEMADLLDKWGLKKIRGKKSTTQMVDRIFGQFLKFYAGIIHNKWTGEDIQGLHKPMITETEMHQIMQVRAGKSHVVKRLRFNPDFLLRRTILCYECLKPLTGSAPRGNGGRYCYYHCRTESCKLKGKGLAKSDVEESFIDFLNKVTPTKKYLEVFKASILDLWQEKGLSHQVDADKSKKKLEDLEKKRERIYDMREDGTYTKEEFIERKQSIDNEIATAKISMSESKIEQYDLEAGLSCANKFMSDLSGYWEMIIPEQKSRFQKLLFPEGVIYNPTSGCRTNRMAMILELKETFQKGKSLTVDPKGFDWNQLLQELRVFASFEITAH